MIPKRNKPPVHSLDETRRYPPIPKEKTFAEFDGGLDGNSVSTLITTDTATPPPTQGFTPPPKTFVARLAVSFIDWVEWQDVTHSLRGSGFWAFTSSIWFLFSVHDGLGDGGHGPKRPSD